VTRNVADLRCRQELVTERDHVGHAAREQVRSEDRARDRARASACDAYPAGERWIDGDAFSALLSLKVDSGRSGA
jgi:hypothetical protein